MRSNEQICKVRNECKERFYNCKVNKKSVISSSRNDDFLERDIKSNQVDKAEQNGIKAPCCL